jgi:hypothetical protein
MFLNFTLLSAAGAQNYCRSAVEVTKKSSEVGNSSTKLNSKAAGQLISEFIDKGAILGSLQFACILTAAEINPQESRGYWENDRAQNLTRSVRNFPRQARTETLAKGYQGFNAAESQIAKDQFQISVETLESLYIVLELPETERNFHIKNVNSRLSYSDSTKSTTKTLIYLADLKKNHPDKYQAFLEAWEASAPSAAKVAMGLRGGRNDIDNIQIKEALVMTATATSIVGGIGIYTGMGIEIMPAVASTAIVSMMVSAGLSNIISPYSYTKAKIKGLGGLIRRTLIKRQVKKIAQQKLSISEVDVQKLVDAEDSAGVKALARVQALEQLDLTQLVHENGVQQVANLDNKMDILQLRQIRIMSGISGELAILTERMSVISKEFETLVSKQKSLLQSDDQAKRVLLAKLGELQRQTFELKLDAQNLLITQQSYLAQTQDLHSILGSRLQDETIQKFMEQIQTQLAIQQGAQQALDIILQKSQSQVEGIMQLSLAVIAKQVTNSVQAH